MACDMTKVKMVNSNSAPYFMAIAPLNKFFPDIGQPPGKKRGNSLVKKRVVNIVGCFNDALLFQRLPDQQTIKKPIAYIHESKKN